jgi:hypothetical protein
MSDRHSSHGFAPFHFDVESVVLATKSGLAGASDPLIAWLRRSLLSRGKFCLREGLDRLGRVLRGVPG